MEFGLCFASGFSWAKFFVADAHRGDNRRRLVVHADETLTAFMELAEATRVAPN
jgi:hypothetical protein